VQASGLYSYVTGFQLGRTNKNPGVINLSKCDLAMIARVKRHCGD
jgi:hypothetical protein